MKLKNNTNYLCTLNNQVFLYCNREFICMNDTTGKIEVYSEEDLESLIPYFVEDKFEINLDNEEN